MTYAEWAQLAPLDPDKEMKVFELEKDPRPDAFFPPPHTIQTFAG